MGFLICSQILILKLPMLTLCGTTGISLIIVAFFENVTIEYSSEALCVSMFVCVYVCASFCTITSKEIDLGT